MVGKMLLPYLGGASSVWTTCVLFFQCMLLLGYVYAHLLARLGDMKKQIATHAVVLLLPLAFLPLRFGDITSESLFQHPTLRLMATLVASAAVPFFVLSTTAPLLQNWFSRTTHAASSDPYFLYSASNAGSLLALIAYPFVIEPRIGVFDQSRLWFAAYVGLILMFGLTVVALQRRRWNPVERVPMERTDWSRRFYWIAASFVPSALMLAVTSHIGANVVSVPFLWLVPLALYLMTFIMSFGRRLSVSPARVALNAPVVLLFLSPLVALGVFGPPGLNWIVIGAHLLLLFVACLLCHAQLAESRPGAQHLTEFYFWVALGGVLGGFFTAILAPALFTTVLEYPLVLALVPFVRGGKWNKYDVLFGAGIAAAMVATWLIFRATQLDVDANAVALAHTVLFFICFRLLWRPQRFAWSFAAMLLVYTFILPGYIERSNRIYADRNFFGVKRVLEDQNAGLRKLFHGDTIHGIESTAAERSGQPLSYYFTGGPVSDVIDMMRMRGTMQRIGVLGLGVGTMAAYADAAHRVRFYEIDPTVELIARNYFTFLSRCGEHCDVVTGDGRLQLAREEDSSFDVILLDAFSSDSVPTHLVSREAVSIYLSKLKPDGVLIFNVSNRYLNLEKLAAALSADAGLVAFARFDEAAKALAALGKTNANHLVAARRVEHLGRLPSHPGWRKADRPADFEPWSDDYSNLLSLIRWY